jgi:putative endonuclease
MRFRACAVYLLSNFTRTVLYTGVTSDLVQRVHEHRERAHPRSFTAQYHVDRLVYYEAFEDMEAAIRREKQIKGWSRAKKVALIRRANPDWDDLWGEIAA